MKLILGDSFEKLKDLPTSTVDAVVTDPPYGLAFMNKHWDYDVPSVTLWKEVFRVLKPGGHLLSFGGTRTYHRMVVAIEDAGFEIRDQVQWIYGSGFPKSHNIGEGRGTALKPANEPIVLARKPLEKGLTVAKNVEKWGTGAINVDASRIGTEIVSSKKCNGGDKCAAFKGGEQTENLPWTYTQGRWPANVLFCEESAKLLDEQSGHLHGNGTTRNGVSSLFGSGEGESDQRTGDKLGGGASRFFAVFKNEEHAKESECKNTNVDSAGLSSKGSAPLATDANINSANLKSNNVPTRFLYQAKASKRERNAGLGDEKCTHPTVKPIKLMEYLCRLIAPPGGIILDPFMGSGSTGVAAKRLGFQFIGIEREQDYIEIARRRIEHAQLDSEESA